VKSPRAKTSSCIARTMFVRTNLSPLERLEPRGREEVGLRGKRLHKVQFLLIIIIIKLILLKIRVRTVKFQIYE
jgi:hypothetical protein